MNNKIVDERILSQKRKIQSDGFQLLSIGLLISALIQEFVYNAPFSQYGPELILFIAASAYVLIRNIRIGNDVFPSLGSGKKLIFINSIVCGLTVTVVSVISNYGRLGAMVTTDIGNTIFVSLITFICGAVGSGIAFSILYRINRKRQQELEKQLNDDDE